MAAKPLTTETIALTEKKMDMTLDDIIKMSKSTTTKAKKQRVSNRSKKFLNNAAQEKSAKVRQFMDSRSSLRQAALAQRRSNFQGNQFPLATEAARKAVVAPIRNRAFNRSRAVNVNKLQGWGSTSSEEGCKWWLCCKEATASEGGAQAEASNIGLTVCEHEGTEDEGFVSTE
uniref:Uncharacterized protein n=1 Tax=Davidia involucrata TaxID=16924 RepID=A0A5B6ZYI8_DAVIN